MKTYLPVKNVPLNKQSPITVLALLIHGEARGEYARYGRVALDAVAHVALNRLAQAPKYGKTLIEVCLKPKQFSCFNPNDPNRRKMFNIKNDAIWKLCVCVAQDAIDGISIDPTNDATHYLTVVTDTAWEKKLTFCVRIGNHDFYKE